MAGLGEAVAVDRDTSTICQVVRGWAERRPEAPALVAEGHRPLTYGTLAELIDRFGRSLNGAGLGRDERVAIVHSGGPALATTVLGVISCATAVPLVSSYTLGEYAIHLHDRKADALLVEAGLDTPARAAAQRLGLPIVEVEAADLRVAGKVALRPGPARAQEARRPGPAQADDIMLVLATSGTTSQSKIVPLRHSNALYQMAPLAGHFQLGEDDRCLLLQPLICAGGLFSLFTSLFAGSSVIVLPGFDAATFFRCVGSLGPTWCAGGHTFHRSIYARAAHFPEAIRGSRLRFLRATSGFLEGEIADGLERVFGVPVIETYASTEAGRISGNPLPPRKRKRGTVGLAIFRDVAILGPGGGFLPAGERGEVVVRGEQVFEGYEDNPAATAEAFVDGWYRTGDEGVFDAEGYLTLTGRLTETINRGGEKIAPAEVDAVLLKHPEVREAACFAIPHSTLGQEVAAAVVLESGAGASDQELTRFLRQHLAGFKVPRRILVVDAIPKNAVGKVQRGQLAQAFEPDDAGEDTQYGQRPPTALEARLQGLWAESLGLERIGLHDNYFLLGGDSLQAVELFLRIEEDLGFRLPRSSLFEAGTVAEQAHAIETGATVNALVPIQPKGERPPFFCVHGGGGHVLNLANLARHIGQDQPFYGFQFTDLERNQTSSVRIEDLAARYIEEMRRVQPSGPYYLGGYSFGGRVAFVMARQLRAAGEEVGLLALFDTYSHFGRQRLALGPRLARHRERVRELGPVAYGTLVLNNQVMRIRRILLRKLSPALRRYFKLRKRPDPGFLPSAQSVAFEQIRLNFRPRPYDGNAVLFKAKLDRWDPPDFHDAWHRLIMGGLEVRPIPGDHYSCMKEPHVRTLAEELVECLESAQAKFQTMS